MTEIQLSQVIEQAVAIEKKVAELAEAKAADEKERGILAQKIKALGEQQLALGRKLLAMQQEGVSKDDTERKDLSLGAQLVSNQSYADLMAGKISRARVELASPVTTPSGFVPEHVRPGIQHAPEIPNNVKAVFTSVPTSSDQIKYLCEKTFTNNAAEVAEGTQKPESTMDFETKNAPVVTIAHFVRVTKQLAADAPALAAYVNARMLYGLNRRIEKQLLNGDGEGENLSGMFKEGNYLPHGFTADNMKADDTVLDLIRRCGATMRKLGYTPTAVFMSPMDFDTIRGMKDKNGAYLMGSPLQAGTDIRPWGLAVIESPEVQDGKFLVADTRMGATIYERQQPVVEMFEQDSDNVQKNLYTIRCECRMAFAIESTKCFVGGDLAIAPGAEKAAKAAQLVAGSKSSKDKAADKAEAESK